MSYIGFKPVQGNVVVDEFTSNGVDSTYTLSSQPTNNNTVEVVVGGLTQTSSAYSFSGNVLTLAGVASGTKIIVRQHGEKLLIPTPGDDSVTTAKIAADAVDGTKIADNAIDSDHIVDGSVDNAHLATGIDATKLTGTVAEARLATLDATKLTGTVAEARLATLDATKLTGSIADARIPESAVTQHVTATDLTPVHQSIATLGLHMGVSANAAAFNLPNAFIDTFEDDTGITTETTVDRDTTGEYVASVYASLSALTDLGSANFGTGGSGAIGNASWNGNDVNCASNINELGSTTDGAATPVVFPANTPFEYHFTPDTTNSTYGPYTCVVPSSYSGDNKIDPWETSSSRPWGQAGSMGIAAGSSAVSVGNGGLKYNPSGGTPPSPINNTNYIGSACKIARNASMYLEFYAGGSLVYTSTSTHTDAYEIILCQQGGQSGIYMRDMQYRITTSAASATGTLISDTQTAPAATTEVSGVILYKDNAGTATLGTQLKIYFTANNGTNWTEAASYGTAQTFSGTTKQVKLGKTTVTSGTQVAMKAVWASQASGSMETQLHGWAVNY